MQINKPDEIKIITDGLKKQGECVQEPSTCVFDSKFGEKPPGALDVVRELFQAIKNGELPDPIIDEPIENEGLTWVRWPNHDIALSLDSFASPHPVIRQSKNLYHTNMSYDHAYVELATEAINLALGSELTMYELINCGHEELLSLKKQVQEKTPATFLWVARDDDEIGHYCLHPNEPTYENTAKNACGQMYLEDGSGPVLCSDYNEDRRSSATCQKCDFLDSIWMSEKLEPDDFRYTPEKWSLFGTKIKLERGEGPLLVRLLGAE